MVYHNLYALRLQIMYVDIKIIYLRDLFRFAASVRQQIDVIIMVFYYRPGKEARWLSQVND